MNNSPWRLERGSRRWMNSSSWSPILRYATPPDEQDPRFDRSAPTQVRFLRFAARHTPLDQQDPVSTVGGPRKSVSSVLRYARPLPINGIPFRPWPVEHKAVSSVLRYARPRFHRLFRPSPPDEHDNILFRPSRLAPHEHDDDAVSPF